MVKRALQLILIFFTCNAFAYQWPSTTDTSQYLFFVTDSQVFLVYPKLTGGYVCNVFDPGLFSALPKGSYDAANNPVSDNLKNYIDNVFTVPALTPTQQAFCDQLAGITNVAPVAQNQSITLSVNTVTNGNVLAIDTDPLTYSLVNPPAGSLVFNQDGSFAYTPLIDFIGIDSFDYTASDGQLLSNQAVVSLNIIPLPPQQWFFATDSFDSGLFDENYINPGNAFLSNGQYSNPQYLAGDWAWRGFNLPIYQNPTTLIIRVTGFDNYSDGGNWTLVSWTTDIVTCVPQCTIPNWSIQQSTGEWDPFISRSDELTFILPTGVDLSNLSVRLIYAGDAYANEQAIEFIQVKVFP